MMTTTGQGGSLCVLILKVHLHHLHHLHHTSTSHGARLVYQSKVAQKLWAFIRTPPPVASYGLHHRYLGLIVSVSNLYLSWPPMVSTLAFSETPSLYQNSTSHGLLWSLPMRYQFACACLSETPSLYQNSTSHGLLWSPPWHTQKL